MYVARAEEMMSVSQNQEHNVLDHNYTPSTLVFSEQSIALVIICCPSPMKTASLPSMVQLAQCRFSASLLSHILPRQALSPMYKSSLASFVRLFEACLSDGAHQPGIPASNPRRRGSTPDKTSESVVGDRLARLSPALQVRQLRREFLRR